MNGSLALLIALVSYGNNFIVNDHNLPVLDFKNSVLIFSNSITFYNSSTHDVQGVIAKNPQEWFNYLKKDGCKRLKIYYAHSKQFSTKDYETAGFVGGGGDWIIEAVYNGYSNFWMSSEKVTNENAPDNRIWATEFHVIKNKSSIVEANQSIEKEKSNLSAHLTEIEKFANENGFQYWGKVFQDANKMIGDPNPSVKYYQDFIVKDQFSLSSRQLLFAASTAYVFGGMGSWNDHYFTNQEKGKMNTKLTSELYELVNQSIIVAVNN